MNYSIIIMAAGKGSRMKSDTPKVLHKLAGRSMLSYITDEAKKLSDDIHTIIYHQAERVKDAITSEFSGIDVIVQDHDNYPGTGGAVMAASPKHEKVLVLNGDMPLVTAEALEPFFESSADVVLSTFVLDDPSGYGRVITAGTQVEKVVEDKDATREEKKINRVNAGVYLFDRSFLESFLPKLSNDNAQEEYYITELIELAIKAGRSVSYVDVDETLFMGVNSKKELSIAEEIMQRRIRDHWMREGVIMHLPETIYIDARARFVGECELESGCVIKGESVIKNSTIYAHSVIEDAVIEGSTVGPMGRIRPGSVLKGSHTGNFVEVKKSSLTGVKAGHLSYLGDATIDEGTNVGAGTITCNYDGINKYKTVIGKNVFIGSDSQLVAPVTLADNTMVAAGTTVTDDVPSEALAISRTEQRNVAGFFHRFFHKKGK
jgi:bifunctional UDP-N-acetylglucosamine pyrophosphorylase/glucosamine-1-phosphate N-acetyltransferase